MTTDHENTRVSDAYRDLAREKTPERLDNRILAMAAHESRSRYGLARAWVRPVAWAATIALSLAFVLELTWFADIPGGNGAPEPGVSAEPERQDADVMRAKQEDSRRRGIAELADVATLTTPATPSADDTNLAIEAGEAAAFRTETPEQDHACAGEARASADTWYDCILDLREQGLDDDAAAELEDLLRAFPDFREPRPK